MGKMEPFQDPVLFLMQRAIINMCCNCILGQQKLVFSYTETWGEFMQWKSKNTSVKTIIFLNIVVFIKITNCCHSCFNVRLNFELLTQAVWLTVKREFNTDLLVYYLFTIGWGDVFFGLLCAFFYKPCRGLWHHNTWYALKGWRCNARALAETPAVVVGGRRLQFGKGSDVWEKLKGTAHTSHQHGICRNGYKIQITLQFHEYDL